MAGTWVVVADIARARIFTPVRKGQSLEQVKELLHPESRTHEWELATDRPGIGGREMSCCQTSPYL